MNDRVDAWIDRLMNKKMRDFDATRRERFALDIKVMLHISSDPPIPVEICKLTPVLPAKFSAAGSL